MKELLLRVQERMLKMVVGYARVSTDDQDMIRQTHQLRAAGCEKIFQETMSGTKKHRPQMNAMLDFIREDDVVVVCELTRISRSTKDLFELVEKIEGKGAKIKSLKENWVDTTTAHGKLLFTMFAGLAQFERDLISERTRETLAAKKAAGIKLGRPRVDDEALKKAIKLYATKEFEVKEIEQMTNISKSTLYREIGRLKDEAQYEELKKKLKK